jgi:hypothetical protein
LMSPRLSSPTMSPCTSSSLEATSPGSASWTGRAARYSHAQARSSGAVYREEISVGRLRAGSGDMAGSGGWNN